MIEVDYRKCVNCDGTQCTVYGSNAEEVVKECAGDGFDKYTIGGVKDEGIQV